jgi:hypothetical protein
MKLYTKKYLSKEREKWLFAGRVIEQFEKSILPEVYKNGLTSKTLKTENLKRSLTWVAHCLPKNSGLHIVRWLENSYTPIVTIDFRKFKGFKQSQEPFFGLNDPNLKKAWKTYKRNSEPGTWEDVLEELHLWDAEDPDGGDSFSINFWAKG